MNLIEDPMKVSVMSGTGEQESVEAHHSASEVCDMLVQVLLLFLSLKNSYVSSILCKRDI